MVSLSRRVLLVFALIFWQGGFTFYTAVVVPIGTEVLQSAEQQGWITRQVTVWLNGAGAVALPLWAWNLAADPASSRTGRILRWSTWAGLLITLLLLVWVHGRMDALLDPVQERIHDRSTFYGMHRVYLWVSTVQWLVALALIVCTLRDWREIDNGRSRQAPG